MKRFIIRHIGSTGTQFVGRYEEGRVPITTDKMDSAARYNKLDADTVITDMKARHSLCEECHMEAIGVE